MSDIDIIIASQSVEIEAEGTVAVAGSSSGDMLASVYDPQEIEADAFDLANMTGDTDDVSEGTTNLYNRQADWNQATNTAPDFIKNKPTLFSGSYNDLTDKPTIPTVSTKRVSVTATDGATPAIDCDSGTEVYVKWEAGTAATAPSFSNVVVDSVIHLSMKKTISGDVTVTFSQSGYDFALEGETAGASKDVVLSGDQNAFFSVILTVTAHEISGDKVVTIAAK
jgi:hypothetical protein